MTLGPPRRRDKRERRDREGRERRRRRAAPAGCTSTAGRTAAATRRTAPSGAVASPEEMGERAGAVARRIDGGALSVHGDSGSPQQRASGRGGACAAVTVVADAAGVGELTGRRCGRERGQRARGQAGHIQRLPVRTHGRGCCAVNRAAWRVGAAPPEPSLLMQPSKVSWPSGAAKKWVIVPGPARRHKPSCRRGSPPRRRPTKGVAVRVGAHSAGTAVADAAVVGQLALRRGKEVRDRPKPS